MKVFILFRTSGEYDDYSEWCESVHGTLATAKEAADTLAGDHRWDEDADDNGAHRWWGRLLKPSAQQQRAQAGAFILEEEVKP